MIVVVVVVVAGADVGVIVITPVVLRVVAVPAAFLEELLQKHCEELEQRLRQESICETCDLLATPAASSSSLLVTSSTLELPMPFGETAPATHLDEPHGRVRGSDVSACVSGSGQHGYD